MYQYIQFRPCTEHDVGGCWIAFVFVSLDVKRGDRCFSNMTSHWILPDVLNFLFNVSTNICLSKQIKMAKEYLYAGHVWHSHHILLGVYSGNSGFWQDNLFLLTINLQDIFLYQWFISYQDRLWKTSIVNFTQSKFFSDFDLPLAWCLISCLSSSSSLLLENGATVCRQI